MDQLSSLLEVQPSGAPDDLLDAVERLAREFDGLHPTPTVAACVRRCRTRLQHAGVDGDLPARAEAMARAMMHHPAMLHSSSNG